MKINTNTIAVGGVFGVLAALAVFAAGQASALSVTVNAATYVQATTTVAVPVNVSATAQLLINQPTPITSTADLATYDDLVVKARPAITAINFDDKNNVTVGYSQPAKFLGLFPTTISGEVMVDAQGNTTVALPWWAIFYAKDTTGVKASVVAATAQSGADFSATAQADAQTRLQNEARVIDAVTAALQAQAVASTSVTAQQY